jgi:hypothetical protein
MESASRLPLDDDHETSAEVRERLGEMVIGNFMRAIDSLDALPQGPSLAMRRVWVRDAAEVASGPILRKDQPEAH